MLEIAPDNDLEQEQDDDDEIVCAGCGHTITRGRWRISRNGDHEHTVFNPAGQIFRVLCFADAPGAGVTGQPTDEFTWFRGFTWQIAHCRGCAVHIGWRYSGTEVFFGLIKDRLKDKSGGRP